MKSRQSKIQRLSDLEPAEAGVRKEVDTVSGVWKPGKTALTSQVSKPSLIDRNGGMCGQWS